MSPASSGSLEVERYIGACLISSQSRHKNAKPPQTQREQPSFTREHFLPGSYNNLDGRFPLQRCNSTDRWAGGMPLISFANQRWRTTENRNCQRPEKSPLARLAVHTQGAPLILANRYNHRKSKVPRQKAENGVKKTELCKDAQNSCDAVSVVSDESSGSNNSDACLPRIIKPRKRRKKDRKPPHLVRPCSQDGSFSTDSGSPDVDSPTNLLTFMPFIPYGFDPHVFHVPEIIPLKNSPKGDISETPKLHHSFEDIEDVDDAKDVNGNASSCQCRYCDPSGQIWDIDRSCYSPFLTPEHQKKFQFNYDTKSYSSPISPSESTNLIDGISTFSLEEDSGKSSSSSSPRSSRDLEVSTEIVTFLNGHRDLEIKFFSTPTQVRARTDVDRDDENLDKNSKNAELCFVNKFNKVVTSEE